MNAFVQEKTDARSVYQGTGLGMAIVKSLVDKMNGTISVTSKEGEGSTFVIRIPFEIASETDDIHNNKEELPDPMLPASEISQQPDCRL